MSTPVMTTGATTLSHVPLRAKSYSPGDALVLPVLERSAAMGDGSACEEGAVGGSLVCEVKDTEGHPEVSLEDREKERKHNIKVMKALPKIWCSMAKVIGSRLNTSSQCMQLN